MIIIVHVRSYPGTHCYGVTEYGSGMLFVLGMKSQANIENMDLHGVYSSYKHRNPGCQEGDVVILDVLA